MKERLQIFWRRLFSVRRVCFVHKNGIRARADGIHFYCRRRMKQAGGIKAFKRIIAYVG